MVDLKHDIIFARQAAEARNIWVVIVVPEQLYATANQVLAAVTPENLFSGRTALYDEGGKVTLMRGSDDLLGDNPFEVMLLGWGNNEDNMGMTQWRKRATAELRRIP